MSLQEKFSRFKQQQQEKCQATLASIAAQASSSRAIQPQRTSTSSAPGASSAAIKFSSDTERLQLINAIRKAPIGAQIKCVIELLRKTRQALTPEQINEACYVDVNSNTTIFSSSKNNPKVSYDGMHFLYKPKHHLSGKEQLLSLIREFPEGLAISDVKDAYPSVMEDLQSLKAAGEVWILSSTYSQEDVAYPNDPRVAIQVDDDLKQMFRSIELPRDMLDVEKELLRSGMKPATNTAKRRAMARMHTAGVSEPKAVVKKRGAGKRRRKLTNVHLPELFGNLHLPPGN